MIDDEFIVTMSSNSSIKLKDESLTASVRLIYVSIFIHFLVSEDSNISVVLRPSPTYNEYLCGRPPRHV